MNFENDILTKIYEESESSREMINKLYDKENNLTKSELLPFWDVLFEEMTEEYNEGELDDTDVSMLADMIVNHPLSLYNKTDITSKIKSNSSGKDPDEIPPINHWVENNIEKVIVSRSTDAKSNTKYQFRIKGYDEFIESEGVHRSWYQFREEIYDVTQQRVDNPEFMDVEPYDDSNDFDAFMDDFITENYEETTYDGPCTTCLDSIKSKINRAFDDIEQAVDRDAPYYNEETNEIYIQSSLIVSESENFGVSIESLQSELDARNVIDGTVSKQISVSGERKRFWILPEDFCEFEVVSDDDAENQGMSRIEDQINN